MRASLSLVALLDLGAGCCSLTVVPSAADEVGVARLRIGSGTSRFSLTLRPGDGDQVHYLVASQDLVSWREIAFSNVAFKHYSLPQQVPAQLLRNSFSTDRSPGAYRAGKMGVHLWRPFTGQTSAEKLGLIYLPVAS